MREKKADRTEEGQKCARAREREWSFYAIYEQLSKIACSTFSSTSSNEMIHVIERWRKKRGRMGVSFWGRVRTATLMRGINIRYQICHCQFIIESASWKRELPYKEREHKCGIIWLQRLHRYQILPIPRENGSLSYCGTQSLNHKYHVSHNC